MAGTLYLVATPIGNLGDLSLRAAETLEQVDFIAAEDTRVTVKLLNHLGLKKPMVSYYRHNTGTRGEELVAQCAAQESPVVPIPGPCAFVNALAVSGLPTGRFTFEGFLAMNKKNRRAHLESLRGETRTMLFHEAPHKLQATLRDLAEDFGPDRRLALCRELTKLHEEVRRTTLGQAVSYYEAHPPKGEFVLVVEGAPPVAAQAPTLEDGLALVDKLQLEGWSTRDAVKEAAAACRLSRKVLYDRVLARKKES